MSEQLIAALVLLALAGVQLLLAWLIGVEGMLKLVSDYRAHPERYPDARGLGRWMAWTLGLGGALFGACGLALAGGYIGLPAMGAWATVTGALLAGGAVWGTVRYRRPAPQEGGAPPRRRH
jgi:hypothetical protein